MENNIALIMCAWNRIDYLNKTIQMLETQTDKDFTFYIWNNKFENKEAIEKIINNKNIKINLFNSEKNIGGFGRFVYAKEIMDKHEIIVFIDDDQIFNNSMIKRFRSEFERNTVKSRWSWRFNGNIYNNRYKIEMGGYDVHYCGTGGMVLPSHVFSCNKIFEIPEEFKFIEDLWLSFVCNSVLKMDLKSITDDGFIYQLNDGKDQFLTLVYKKDKFMDHLIKVEKWKLT